MRVLVAGGAGFIGANLCRHLHDLGCNVVCLDNLSSGRLQNLDRLLASRRFELITHDIVEPLPSLPAVERVYHLASPASPPGYRDHPIETLRVNSEGSRRLLDYAAVVRARFLLASTSEVYGDPLVHPQHEDYRGNVSSTGARSMYDEAKRFAEALAMAYHRVHDVDVRVVRLFNAYGPHSNPNDGRLIPNFITQALTGAPLTIYGTGRQTRSLCYVDDIVRALVLVMESEAARGDVFNVGNPDEREVLEYAETVRRITGSASALAFSPPAVGDDPQRRRPDITRIRSVLGWEPEITLEEGLERTVEYFRRELGRPALDDFAERSAAKTPIAPQPPATA